MILPWKTHHKWPWEPCFLILDLQGDLCCAKLSGDHGIFTLSCNTVVWSSDIPGCPWELCGPSFPSVTPDAPSTCDLLSACKTLPLQDSTSFPCFPPLSPFLAMYHELSSCARWVKEMHWASLSWSVDAKTYIGKTERFPQHHQTVNSGSQYFNPYLSHSKAWASLTVSPDSPHSTEASATIQLVRILNRNRRCACCFSVNPLLTEFLNFRVPSMDPPTAPEGLLHRWHCVFHFHPHFNSHMWN